MNCQDFNYHLYEYVDGTLGPEVQAVTQEHLRQCAVCRSALLGEEKLAKSIRYSLQRATAGLSLRPEIRRNVLSALHPESAPAGFLVRVWQSFSAIPLRPLGAVAALLLLGGVLLLLAVQLHRPKAQRATPQVATQIRQEDGCVIHVPLQTQTHLFRRQNGTVLDVIVSGVALAHADLPKDSQQPSKLR